MVRDLNPHPRFQPDAPYIYLGGEAYCVAQTMRAIQTTSDMANVRSRCSVLSDLSSTVLVVLRLSSLTMTSPFLVLTTTRSPLCTGAAGDTTMMSPSR